MLSKASLVPLCAALLCWGVPSVAQERFKTPEAAVDALVAAAKAEDTKALVGVLGPDGRAIVSSGDPVADTNIRKKFVEAFEAKRAIEREGDGTQTLIIGADDWPFPIPLMNKAGEWQFETAAGLDEILRRRIGRNELAAIQVSLAYVQAQNEYASLDPGGLGPHIYAQRIVSRRGKKDGLYWPTSEGDTPSPLGELAAQASAEGYKAGAAPVPYHGYYYRILTRQGGDAPGGAYDYLVNGKMIGGFGLLVFPAQYGNSGIMTFMVNQDATVYQKDLGSRTDELARKIDAFAPDQTWTKVEPSQ